ncbi:hypothetical protein UM89_20820 [Bacillus subtilis]|nr:hypothetical protein UM89_20820 [Bacillus subtilis]
MDWFNIDIGSKEMFIFKEKKDNRAPQFKFSVGPQYLFDIQCKIYLILEKFSVADLLITIFSSPLTFSL